ncbi:class C sortase [Peptostreptococcus canis]|uniref:Class C sortase n=1 Tax=Peptostreptococcus canis TaxID=1159213 RepID=A0ABR6TL61_9FIRM|nr:class C sortase [Peptostreptococcus canis]MBC2576142.1 class C sortase [Peptostreptococcus canis]MBP1998325.1 LPXTG-site transpeptidase (sortase) family protein [Peptostreptococcus canis]
MKKRKIIGLLIFMIGILIITYPFFSMSIDDFAQYRKNEEYKKEIKKENNITKQIEILRNNKKSKEDLKGNENRQIKDVFSNQNNKIKEKSDLEKIGIDLNKKVGFISIPKLGQSFDLYLDADYKKIAKGVAVLPESDLPIGGDGTRCVIAGHSGYYNKLMFLNIHKLENNDKILINFMGKELEYEVYGMEKIYPDQSDKLRSEEGKDILTLLTCTQAPRYNMRLLVNAKRVNKISKIDDNSEISNSSIIKYISNKNIDFSVKLRKIFPYIVSTVNVILIALILLKIIRILKNG